MTLAARLGDWLWIPVSSWLEPDGTRITVPAHWFGGLVVWRRRAERPAWGPVSEIAEISDGPSENSDAPSENSDAAPLAGAP